jgi:hypothetical protein
VHYYSLAQLSLLTAAASCTQQASEKALESESQIPQRTRGMFFQQLTKWFEQLCSKARSTS